MITIRELVNREDFNRDFVHEWFEFPSVPIISNIKLILIIGIEEDVIQQN